MYTDIFHEVTYDANAGTATIGAGLIWDDVYNALEPYAVNIVGGRVTGVGVAGELIDTNNEVYP